MIKDCVTAWNGILSYIRENVGQQSFDTWFKPISPVKLEDNVLTIQVPSQFFYEWLEEHYVSILRKAIHNELGISAKLEYSIVVDKGSETNKPYVVNIPTSKISPKSEQFKPQVANPFDIQGGLNGLATDSHLNSHYTFDTYIEGDCNRLARSAGLAVTNKPGITSFNPLFIYSGVGLGKTHLVQAIGNKLESDKSGKFVLYVSSEKFANQVIEAFKNNKIQEFANYYLQVDVLIVDDIQFLSGKEKTQEIFFHIFNHLHQSGKQIIMTSDCPPKELKGLQERLISRFKWGLTADLQQPDFETRMAIIHQKLDNDGIVMPKEVIEYIAYSVDTNVRELEGVIVSLIAQSSLARKEIDLDLAKQALQSIVQNIDVEVNMDYIQKFVQNYFDISIELMKAKTRKREVVVARQVSMYLAKEYTNMSLKSIGAHFGGRDHSTVIHAITTVNDMMDTDQQFNNTMQDVLKKVKMRAKAS